MLKNPLPNQIDDSSPIYEAVSTVNVAVLASVAVASGTAFVLSFLASFSLNQLLGMVKNILMISHLPLLTIFVPALANMYLEVINAGLTFDFYDVSEYIQEIFDIKEDDAEIELEDNLVQLGYESGLMPMNFGTVMFIIFFQVIATVMLLTMGIFCCCKKCRKWVHGKIDGIFFNSILTVIDSIFILIVMTAAINVKLVTEGDLPINSSFYASIFGLGVCFIELISVSIFLRVNISSLDENRRTRRCGYIYEGLNFKIRGGKALVYPLLYQLRFLILVYTVLYLQEYMVAEVLLITQVTIFMISVLGTVHPLQNIRMNYNEMASEAIVIIVLDLLLVATDPTIEPEKKNKVFSLSIISIISLSILISVAKMIYNNFRMLKLVIIRCLIQ